MPRKPNVPCKHPSCPALVPYGRSYCEKHQVLHRSDRLSASKRGYDSRWRKARARFLKDHPLCVKCKEEGILVKATVVDHIVPHRGDQRLFWDESNWQPLCKKCHDKKTMTEDKYVVNNYQ
ncbi:HNH endonuclease signature motif containing protein [Anaerotignum propionicum]|uniref:HNH endonuclease n=1 Tax=Anaerotignum propionicum TaxID=28446 RepID=UPI0028A0AA40|nr:HNH endonuclease signature motif containing protein [Anaerotignum propionicum]